MNHCPLVLHDAEAQGETLFLLSQRTDLYRLEERHFSRGNLLFPSNIVINERHYYGSSYSYR